MRPVSTPVGGLATQQFNYQPGQRVQTMSPMTPGQLQRATSERNIGFQRTKPNTQRPQSGRVRLASTRRGSGMFEPVNPTVPPVGAMPTPVANPALSPVCSVPLVLLPKLISAPFRLRVACPLQRLS